MAAQLPTVGGSEGSWGTGLNGFLGAEHNADGTHDGKIPAITAKMYLSADQDNLTDNVITKVLLDTDSFDTDGITDPTTNNRITPSSSGYYLCIGSVRFEGTELVDEAAYSVSIYKNGATK